MFSHDSSLGSPTRPPLAKPLLPYWSGMTPGLGTPEHGYLGLETLAWRPSLLPLYDFAKIE